VVRIPTRIAAALAVAALLAGGGTVWLRARAARAFFDPHVLLSRFPAEDALAMSVDFATLRRAGLLGQSSAPLEAEYKQFLDGTGFDYRQDLDSVVASFSASGTFFIARGRFDWAKLRDYAAHNGGACYEDLCRMQGSRPDRHISFLPLRKDAIALAVSTNDLAATKLTKTGPRVEDIPDAPAWISVPGAELRRQNAMPPEMHLLLSALTSADRVIITFGALASGEIEAHLEATCRTKDDARVLASQLRTTTSLLKEALSRAKPTSGDDVITLLTAGRFDQKDRLVTGNWPVRRSLLDALTNGI
jgi:hypothetical protein